ncbi:hypothetical protein [Bradyrhizobium sp. CCBAU 45389]|uniref:hypothetical protein n=1 Tax=Bradyrhizobium sp. CCBAU 45389 TaxID=858429 RepID=UPI002306218F|nr:hypothetical protein [Bradyrhizobium sp. CCBAU 45389]
MQLYHANTLERIETAADHDTVELAMWPVTLDRLDFSTSDRDEVLALLRQGNCSKGTLSVVLVALAGGIGLGWAGALFAPAAISALNPIASMEAASRRMPSIKPVSKVESTRKTASASSSRTPPGFGGSSTFTSSLGPKPLAKAPSVAQLADVLEPDMSITGSVQPTGLLLPVPETRPTTIVGWAVLDVRAGTAVLEGPDGIRMAARGDEVPGIGRIDSIVRWGNRWIVATASGLISTP